MATVSLFLTLTIFSMCFTINAETFSYNKCYITQCDSYTPSQLVGNLWKLPRSISPLVTKYKNVLLSLVPAADTKQISILLAHSLWAVDVNTGFQPSISPMCVFNKLIKTSLQKQNGEGRIQDHNQAIKDYGLLCKLAISNSVKVGLAAAGCPYYISPLTQTPIECQIDISNVEPFLNSKSGIPDKLKSIIRSLIKSNNKNENVIGMAALASYCDCNLNLFSFLMNTDELVKAVQLKACNIRISSRCCKYRQRDLESRCDLLAGVTDTFINKLVS